MLNIHVDILWATVSPIRANTDMWLSLSAITSYQPEGEIAPVVRLLEYVSDSVWRFPAGLWLRVKRVLDEAKVPYTVTIADRDVERRDYPSRLFPLRPYQTTAVMALLRGELRGGVLQAATGAGKTAMAAKLIHLLHARTLFCVHTKDLMRQAKDMFENLLGIEIGIIGGGGKTVIKDVNIATIQTLSRGGYDMFLNQIELAIFDECHHVAAPTVYAVRNKMRNASVVVGLSASPWRDDGHDMMIEAACGPVKYQITASDLIEQGFLVQPEIVVYRRQLPTHLRGQRTGKNFFADLYRDVIVEDAVRNDFVAKLTREQLDQGRRVLVLVKHIEHGMQLASRIEGSIFVEGSNSASARAAAFDGFREGSIRCLIGTSLCDEGVDIPAADALILAGAGASSTRALQRIGRVIRTAPGKTSAYVADIVDEHASFRKQFYRRRRIYQSERLFTIREVQVPLDDYAVRP